MYLKTLKKMMLSNLNEHSPFIQSLIKKRMSSNPEGKSIHVAAFVDSLKQKKSSFIKIHRKDRDW